MPIELTEYAGRNAVEALCRDMVITLQLLQRTDRLGDVTAACVRDNLARAELLGLVSQERPDSMKSVEVRETSFVDFLDTVAETQPACFDLGALGAQPWPLPPQRRATTNGA
jgi:hypothetical protein